MHKPAYFDPKHLLLFRLTFLLDSIFHWLHRQLLDLYKHSLRPVEMLAVWTIQMDELDVLWKLFQLNLEEFLGLNAQEAHSDKKVKLLEQSLVLGCHIAFLDLIFREIDTHLR